MEEKYPTVTPDPQPEITKETSAFREELKKRVTFNVKDVSPEVKKCVEMLPGTTSNVEPLKELPVKEPFVAPVPPVQEQKPTVNKNAYEIRADVLAMALDWVRYKDNGTISPAIASDDVVLETAQKFYRFVENRR